MQIFPSFIYQLNFQIIITMIDHTPSQRIIQPFQIEEPQFPTNIQAYVQPQPIDQFNSNLQYVLTLVGFAVGYGSFWRFPYLIYKNGGGVFFIPYFLSMFLVGVPLLYLETIVGQMHQCSLPIIFSKINKGYKLIGMTFLAVCFHLSGYYNIILAYSYEFLFSSFYPDLPYKNETPFQDKYFTEYVLNMSGSIQQFGSIQPGLFFFYIFSIFICYLVVKNGVKQSGKVVIVTTILPYISLLILAIRGIFLDGALNGIRYLFNPDFSKLLQPQMWVEALVQVFFQMGIAVGAVVNFSSMKPKKQKFLSGVFIVPISLAACGMLSSLNIFIYLGHFCQKQGLQINQLTLSGPSLSFNVFPKALAILPLPNLWIFIFFLTMVFLGIDTEFGAIQTVFCYIKDEVVNKKSQMVEIFNKKYHIKTVKIVFSACICVFCPFLTCSAGIYYLQYFDNFAATIPLSLGSLIIYFFFVKLVPFDQLEVESIKFTGQFTPLWIKYLLKGNIILAILLGNLFLACLNQFLLFFQYPFSYYLVGWIITVYPYVIAYMYYLRNKQQKDKKIFLQLKKIQYPPSQ